MTTSGVPCKLGRDVDQRPVYTYGMPSKPTAADLDLCHQLRTERGISAGTRQVQEWRRLGLISHDVVALGRGKGTASAYGPDALNEACRVAGALAMVRDLDLVVLGVFGIGHDPAERALRLAYKRHLDSMKVSAVDVLAPWDEGTPKYIRFVRDGMASLRSISPTLADNVNRRAKELATSRGTWVDPAFDNGCGSEHTEAARWLDERSTLVTEVLGTAVDPIAYMSDAIPEGLATGLGLPTDRSEPPVPSFTDMSAALDASTLADIIAARDQVRETFRSGVLTPALVIPALRPLLDQLDNPVPGGIAFALAVPALLASEALANLAGVELPAPGVQAR